MTSVLPVHLVLFRVFLRNSETIRLERQKPTNVGGVINLYLYSSHLLNRVKQQRIQLWLNHYCHHNRTEEQNKSPSVQKNDILTIFPYIKSTNNYPTMCVGGVNG